MLLAFCRGGCPNLGEDFLVRRREVGGYEVVSITLREYWLDEDFEVYGGCLAVADGAYSPERALELLRGFVDRVVAAVASPSPFLKEDVFGDSIFTVCDWVWVRDVSETPPPVRELLCADADVAVYLDSPWRCGEVVEGRVWEDALGGRLTRCVADSGMRCGVGSRRVS